MHLQTLAITINQSLIGHDRYYEAGFGAPHAPTRALRKLARVEEFWWAVQDSNSTATPQAGQQNGPAPANSTKPGTFFRPKRLKKGSGFLILRCFFVQTAIVFSFSSLIFLKRRAKAGYSRQKMLYFSAEWLCCRVQHMQVL